MCTYFVRTSAHASVPFWYGAEAQIYDREHADAGPDSLQFQPDRAAHMNAHRIALPLALAAGLLVAACADKTEPRDAAVQDSSRGASPTARRSSADEPKPPTPAAPVAVRELPFKRSELPKEFGDTREILGGARWIDAGGDNVIVITGRTVPVQTLDPSRDDEAQRQEIAGYCYVTRDGATQLAWKIADFAENPCDAGQGLMSDIVVKDVDGDGIAESAFVYNVVGSCDVSPIPMKLLMHSGRTKYAVRGTKRVSIGNGEFAGGEFTYDPAFDAAPPSYREFAAELWKQHSR